MLRGIICLWDPPVGSGGSGLGMGSLGFPAELVEGGWMEMIRCWFSAFNRISLAN